MSNIVTGRQLRAARILAGLTRGNWPKRSAFTNAPRVIGN
jgi:hypothetical protein